VLSSALIIFGASLHAEPIRLAGVRGYGALPEILKAVNHYHPQIKASRYSADALIQDVVAVQRRRWPIVTAAVESDTAEKNTAPSQYLQLDYTIWDAGRLEAQIEEAGATANSGEVSIQVERQRIFLETASHWQAYTGALQRVSIAKNINEHLVKYQAMMQRRVSAEVSPPIDLQLVDSRLLQNTVDLMQAEASAKVALGKLVKVSGLSLDEINPILNRELPNEESMLKVSQCAVDQCWMGSLAAHPTVRRATLEYKAAEMRLRAKEAETKPNAYIKVVQPVDVGSGRANENLMQSSIFVGLRFNSGSGIEAAAQSRSLGMRLASAHEAIDLAKQEIALSFEADAAEFLNSKARVNVQKAAVRNSKEVLDSYTAQFVAARKTWLDLLNAVRDLSQSRLALADAQVNMASSYYRLRIRLGDILESQ